jgi:hypothetical protein
MAWGRAWSGDLPAEEVVEDLKVEGKTTEHDLDQFPLEFGLISLGDFKWVLQLWDHESRTRISIPTRIALTVIER